MFCTFAHSSLIIWYMLYYIKKYPVSLFIILTVIYLSFFKPPSTEISKIPNIDKVVHICMYFGMSGMLWLVELLQEYCTTYRGGDWLDFAANTTGVVLASMVGYFILRPRMK